MRIDDTVGADVDPRPARGAGGVQRLAGRRHARRCPVWPAPRFALSPVQAAGSDPVVKTTTWTSSTGTVTIPGRTVAVLLQP